MAVGIGLVFGVLRLVNFAYGQLVMAGAYALALTNDLDPVLSILVCFAVVIALTMTMDVVAFRPLRRHGASPATMLVATFAISFLLQSIATLRLGVLGKTVGTLTGLNRPIGNGTLIVRWIWIVAIVVAAVALALLLLLLNRTSLGLHMRAAATDFRTARLLGVRANAVISLAVLASGAIAAIVAVVMTVENSYVTSDYGARHDHRPRRRRRRWDRPAVERDARRFCDRVRDRLAERLPAEHRHVAAHERRLPRFCRVRTRHPR